MKKDILQLKVEDVGIAIVPREKTEDEEVALWDTFLVNLMDSTLRNVLINSKGYGQLEGEARKTTTLRHYFEEIGPKRCVLIEPIPEDLFQMANEYWISFVHDGYMYDRKYVFVKGSISEEHFTTIPIMERKGVMIR
jgi:hypothetical protein